MHQEVKTVEAGPIRDRKLFNKIRQIINLINDQTFLFPSETDASTQFR